MYKKTLFQALKLNLLRTSDRGLEIRAWASDIGQSIRKPRTFVFLGAYVFCKVHCTPTKRSVFKPHAEKDLPPKSGVSHTNQVQWKPHHSHGNDTRRTRNHHPQGRLPSTSFFRGPTTPK